MTACASDRNHPGHKDKLTSQILIVVNKSAAFYLYHYLSDLSSPSVLVLTPLPLFSSFNFILCCHHYLLPVTVTKAIIPNVNKQCLSLLSTPFFDGTYLLISSCSPLFYNFLKNYFNPESTWVTSLDIFSPKNISIL